MALVREAPHAHDTHDQLLPDANKGTRESTPSLRQQSLFKTQDEALARGGCRQLSPSSRKGEEGHFCPSATQSAKHGYQNP